MRVLWLVQDGVLAGPGASQTVPYLIGLSGMGFQMSLLSFEKEEFLCRRNRLTSLHGRLRRAGVTWRALPFGSGPAIPRTLAQLLRAVGSGWGMARDVDLIHARSYVPGLVAASLPRPFVFDLRGLWPQEKVDAGLWREGSVVHRVWRGLERRLLDRAAGVVLLAEGAREHLPELSVPVKVIPTAVDLTRFRPGLPVPEGAAHLVGKRVLVLAGALSAWYLQGETLDLSALAIRRDHADHILILSEEDRRPAVEGLSDRGVPESAITDLGVPHEEVPNWFSLAHAGILLIESAPSKRASAPTKLGELLACGVPVLTTPRIGDTEEMLRTTRTGVIVNGHDERDHERALQALGALREEGAALTSRCRETARSRLSLVSAVNEYAALYEALKERKSCG
jgi:glycosyltransferase involved in cell wall biosynthesis